MKLAYYALSAMLGLYAIYGAMMIALHTKFIYPFQNWPFAGTGYEAVQINPDLQVQVFAGQTGAPIIVYFMGNAGALEAFRVVLDHHKARGRSVVAMAYRGGGGLPGTASEKVLKQDAMDVMAALPGLVPEGPVIIQGYSLGTGIALHVAARHQVRAVILSAPYDRLCRLMARASYLPACLLPVQRWVSARDAPNVQAPVLAQHGTEDTLIPIAEGEKLAARLPDHQFLPVEGAGHNDLFSKPGYLAAMDAFIDAHTR